MTHICNSSRENGSILIIIAGIIAALALLGMTFIVLTSSRSSETENYYNMEKARQAAVSALEYAMASCRYVEKNPPVALLSIHASDLPSSIGEVNKILFENATAGTFYYIKDRGDFPHDAYDLTPHTNSLLGSISDTSGTNFADVEETLDPVGAVYTAVFEPFDGSGLVDPTITPPNTMVPLDGILDGMDDDQLATITLLGWGRVFDRVGENGYSPLCDEACIAKVRLKFTGGTLTIIDPTKPEDRTYSFSFEVECITKRKKISIGDTSEGWTTDDWRGKTWFLQD